MITTSDTSRSFRIMVFLMFVGLAVIDKPVAAQSVGAGRVANPAAGELGARQDRNQSASNIAPADRINNRITNRVQLRIRNRIDRFYNPQANAASPFSVASEQARRSTNDGQR